MDRGAGALSPSRVPGYAMRTYSGRPSSSIRFGSVRARAKQYRLSWDEANPGSCGLQDGQHGHAAEEEPESAAIGGNMLMVAGARAEEAAQFIVCATEPSGGSGTFEAPHWSVAPFDAAVVLLQPIIQVSTG